MSVVYKYKNPHEDVLCYIKKQYAYPKYSDGMVEVYNSSDKVIGYIRGQENDSTSFDIFDKNKNFVGISGGWDKVHDRNNVEVGYIDDDTYAVYTSNNRLVGHIIWSTCNQNALAGAALLLT